MSNKLKHFKYLVESGNPVGEVVAVNRYLVRVQGLHPIQPNALVMFEDGSKGYVRAIESDYVSVLHLGADELKIGVAVVRQHQELVAKVGEGFVGRVVSVTGDPLDGKGPIVADAVWPIFNKAPALIGREQLNDQLETGVTLIDSIFPIVLGQRLAILGDSKSGKSTLLAQVALNQKDSDRIVVYVLIAKRRADVNDLLTKLEKNDAMKNAIVVVSTTFDSLAMSYLAPYVACSLAEFLWQKKDRDVIVIYDDLTNHAHVYREISLMAGVSPGRDSYPGDMFFAHSSLLERAGRLASNKKTLTCFPIVHVPDGDISTYLPTNVMSITDGQLILDMKMFRDGVRPAISTGLSVSRVGGRGHDARQKGISARLLRVVAQYKQAAEFAHFGSELALEARADLEKGQHILEAFTQAPGEYFSLQAQQIVLEAIMNAEAGSVLDVPTMKAKANELAPVVNSDETFKKAVAELAQAGLIEMKGAENAVPAATDSAETTAAVEATEASEETK